MKDYDVLLTRDINATESATFRVTAKDKKGAYDTAHELAVNDSGDVDWATNEGYHDRLNPYLGDCLENDVIEVEHESYMPVLVKLPRKIEIDIAVDWIITAIEGGIDYWCGIFEYEPDSLFQELNGKQIKGISCGVYTSFEFWERDGGLRLFDAEGDQEPFPTLLTMEALIQALPKLKPEIIDRLLTGQYDADDADVLVQIAVLGEVTFG